MGQQAEQGVHLEVEEGKGRVENDLEDGIDSNQDGAVLGAAVGQLVPQEHHGDAACQAHQNHPGPVVRQIWQCRPCKCHLHIYFSFQGLQILKLYRNSAQLGHFNNE